MRSGTWAAACRKEGRPAQIIVSGDTKSRGRPPAGSTKGAVYGFRIHTQRQQGHRAPFAADPCTNRGSGGIIRTQCAELSVAMEGSLLRCRGRVCQHPNLHCTFLCACNQIIPLSANLSSRRDADNVLLLCVQMRIIIVGKNNDARGRSGRTWRKRRIYMPGLNPT